MFFSELDWQAWTDRTRHLVFKTVRFGRFENIFI